MVEVFGADDSVRTVEWRDGRFQNDADVVKGRGPDDRVMLVRREA